MVGAVLVLAEAVILETDGIIAVTMGLVTIVFITVVFIAVILIAIIVIAMGHGTRGALITLDETVADRRTGDRTVIHIATCFIFFTFSTLGQAVMLFARTRQLRLLFFTRRVFLAAIEIESLPMAFEAVVVFILSSHDCDLVQTRAIALPQSPFLRSQQTTEDLGGGEMRGGLFNLRLKNLTSVSTTAHHTLISVRPERMSTSTNSHTCSHATQQSDHTEEVVVTIQERAMWANSSLEIAEAIGREKQD